MKKTALLFTLLTVGACASSDPSYVSPEEYAEYNCKQIRAEMNRVSTKIEQAQKQHKETGTEELVLNTALAAFAVSRGYNVGGSDNSGYERLVNQYDVLEKLSIQKECGL